MKDKPRFAFHHLRLLLAVSLGLLLVAILVSGFLLQSANPFDKTYYKITIPLGATVKEIQEILGQAKVLPSAKGFFFFSKILGWQDQLQAGIYDFSPSDSWIKILWKLKNGRTSQPKTRRVTFPEGTSIYKMSIILKNAGFFRWEEFQNLIQEGISPQRREEYEVLFKDLPSESLEGYLFPDTYLIFEDASVEVLAKLMLDRFIQVIFPFWEKSKKDSSPNLHEILTLASIIEKEARLPEERPIISSIFHNRLKAQMPLAADPTIKYILERPTKKVYLHQLTVNSPYNTYQRRGLPPGPICNPGLAAIEAAMYPAKTNYFFFVAKPDGSHIFSSSGEEHQKARKRVGK